MPTTHSDQFFVMDPGNPPPGGSALTVQNFSYVDNNDDGFIGTGVGDTFNGAAVTSVWLNDTITVNIPGTGNVLITGVTFYVSGQPAVFTPTDGTVLQNATFVSSTYVFTSTQVAVGVLGPACFAAGTLIETSRGAVAIETIREGDLVLTADDGMQPVDWIGRSTVPAVGKFAPIRFARGVLGNLRDLLVSPQHRMLIDDWRAELYAGRDAVLIPAHRLVDGKDVCRDVGGMVTYIHLGFEGHALVKSEGIWSESHFASVASRREAKALFHRDIPAAQTVRPVAFLPEAHVIAACALS